MSELTSVMLAAGGTGGHLFPAFALAEELARRGMTVDLVTDHRSEKYGGDFPGREVYRVPSATLASRSPVAAAKTAAQLALGTRAALKLLKKTKPGVVIGFGGYPTFPPLFAARLLSLPTAIHEQNAVLGRANRMLVKRVTGIATSFERTKYLDGALGGKTTLTGNPVRQIVIDCAGRDYFEPETGGPFSILVFGGSQGASYLSDAVPPALASLPAQEKARLHIVQQAREEDLARVRAAYAEAGIVAEVAPFFSNLPALMAGSHLVIGRAGASSVAELTVIGRPSILVPLPHALDNDQLNNARRLEEAGGAWCFEQKTLTPERLAGEIARLMADPEALARASVAAKKVGRPDAVVRLADFVVNLAQKKGSKRSPP